MTYFDTYDKFKGKVYKSYPLSIEDFILAITNRLIFLFNIILLIFGHNSFKVTLFNALLLTINTIVFCEKDKGFSFFWTSSVNSINNYKILKDNDINKIKDKLFIEELPVDVDLADYFKQREIDLVEMKDVNLMKKQYLKEKEHGVQ